MKYDCCERTVSNTLYEIGVEGQPSYKRLCAICHLGEKEGSKPKYWDMSAFWTDASLASWKAKPWPEDADPAEKSTWKWSKKDGWEKK